MNNTKELALQAMSFAYEKCKTAGRVVGHQDHIWMSITMGKYTELIIDDILEVVAACVRSGDTTEEVLENLYRIYRKEQL